jgi:ADP-ribose pyrophosphatase YjhB (NUDIX family)
MGLLHGWRVCPRCGAALEHDEGCATCPSCSSVYYANAAPTASALVLDDESRLLLARRAVEPYAGMWDTVGGFLEETETPEDALVREVREETGLGVERGAYVGTFVDRYGEGEDVVTTLNLVFEADACGGSPTPADDVAELAWFPLGELPEAEEFAFHEVGRFVHEWAASRNRVKHADQGPIAPEGQR